MTFKTNRDNNDYIMINAKIDLGMLIFEDKITEKIKNEVGFIYSSLFKYEYDMKCSYISDIAINKNSDLVKFLIEKASVYNFGNEDLIVDYDKVVNALNIAIFEENPIAKSILPLFKNQVSGKKDELVEQYNKEVIEYILENEDFNYYIENINGTYKPEEYIVYENGEFTKKILLTEPKKFKK